MQCHTTLDAIPLIQTFMTPLGRFRTLVLVAKTFSFFSYSSLLLFFFFFFYTLLQLSDLLLFFPLIFNLYLLHLFLFQFSPFLSSLRHCFPFFFAPFFAGNFYYSLDLYYIPFICQMYFLLYFIPFFSVCL